MGVQIASLGASNFFYLAGCTLITQNGSSGYAWSRTLMFPPPLYHELEAEGRRLAKVYCKFNYQSDMLCRNVVMVPDPNLDKALTVQADLVLGSLEEFNPTVWGLPPYPS